MIEERTFPKRSIGSLLGLTSLGIQFEKEVAPCDALIYFDVPDPMMTERLLKRGETSGRIDDNKETIGKRLHTFHEETTPILGYYGKQGKLITIEANRKPDEVFTDVSQALQRLMEQHQVGKQPDRFLLSSLVLFLAE
jgi:thymidylate kinase